MKSGQTMQQLIGEVKELAEKISSGQISRDELDQFVDATSFLHHKAVILRYKAFENKVLGKNQPLELPEDKLEESATTQAAVEYDEPSVNMQAIQDEIQQPVEVEQPVAEESAAAEQTPAMEELQSDLQSAHEEDEPTFDLFSLDLNENEEIAPATEQKMPVMADEGQASAMEIEEEAVPESQPEPSQPVEAPQPASHQPAASSSLHAIYNRIDRPDDSFTSRFPVNRIENLNVAFGFNERLQTINELFGGSSEVFSSALNELQHAGSQDRARMIVSRYAQENSWNASDDLAISFAKKVDQLYA